MHLVTRCLVNQMEAIAKGEERIRRIHQAIGDPVSLSLSQLAHFQALAMEYRPDLVIELGRGHGNSTAAFCEAVQSQGDGARVASFCISDQWERVSAPRLRAFLPDAWFSPLRIRRGDIRSLDFAQEVGEAARVLVLWDAHGWEVADCVLARLMPVIAEREHFVIMHDISDARHCAFSPSYGGLPFWRGQEGGWGGGTARLRLGWVETAVEQSICAIDFLTRNGLELGSADEVLHRDLALDPSLRETLRSGYPAGLFQEVNHWAFFSLNDGEGPYHFPAYPDGPLSDLDESQALSALRSDLRRHAFRGRRSPLTYARVLAKLFAGRYPGL